MSAVDRQLRQRTNTILLFVLFLVIPLAYFLNIWSDEASTLYSTQNGIADALRNAAANEKQAPLYFWVLSLWRSISGSIFFARLFSVLCVLAAIKLFAATAARIFSPRAALLATAFFAFHPFLIWSALEIRVYAAVILLSVLLIRLFLDNFWEDRKPSWKQTLLFTAVATAALYANYYLGFLLAGLLAALIVTRRWRSAAIYMGSMLIVGLAFLPLLFVAASQLDTNTSGFQASRSAYDGVQRLWRHFLTFVLPAGVFPDGDGSLVLLARLWIVRAAALAAIFCAFRFRRRLSELTMGLFALVATIFACLLAAYFILGPIYLEIRHMSVLFVPLVLFLASFVSDLFKMPAPSFAILAPAVVVLLFFAFSLATLYPGMTKRGDWARVAAFIEANESAGQPIIVFTTFDALALPYHYHGRNVILPDERFFEFELEAEFGSVDSLRKQTDFVISEIPPDAEQIWLAVNEKCLTTDACIPLQNFIAANYTIEKEKELYLEKVFLLRKKR